jgi:heme/copper-type cytochrome/quinol oxidase subunit 3
MSIIRQQVLDVSHLPTSVADDSGVLWWGNALMLVIESTMFSICIATYFYLRVANMEWPPPTVHVAPMLWPTIALAALLLSIVPMIKADRAALKGDRRGIVIGFAICFVVVLAATIIRFQEFFRLDFKWSSHAYGSIIWALLVLHLVHLVVAMGELGVLITYSLVHGLDDEHLEDVRCTAIYWYFVVFWWIPIYVLTYVAPRITSYS